MRYPILITLALALTACGSSGPTSPAPTGTTPTVTGQTLLASGTIPASGGALTVAKAGDPLNGLSITLPSGAYPAAADLTISSSADSSLKLPAGFTRAGPLILITNSQLLSDSLLQLSIPATVGPDSSVAAFSVDPATGEFGVLPQTRSSTQIFVYSRHFSGDALITAPAAAPAATAGVVSRATSTSAKFGSLVIVTVKAANVNLEAPTTTTFKPGQDDWEFVNYGTYTGPEGICAGMAITEMYYHYKLRSQGPLYAKYNDFPSNTYTDAAGLRLASQVQFDYEAKTEKRQERFYNLMKGKAVAAGIDIDEVAYLTTIMALRLTGRPQLLGLVTATFSHAVVAFAADKGAISFADPNSPGTTRTMTFVDRKLTPFAFSANAGGTPATVIAVVPQPIDAFLDVTRVAALWSAVPNASVGKDIFPDVTFEMLDSRFANKWIPVPDGTQLVVPSVSTLFRARCATCGYKAPGTGAADLQGLSIVRLAGDPVAVQLQPTVTLKEDATAPLGLISFGNQDAKATDLTWGGFRALQVEVRAMKLKTAPATPKTTDAVTLTADVGNLKSRIATYKWEYGDPTAVASTTAPSTTHTYTTAGSYLAKLKGYDANNVLIAADSVTLVIAGDALLYSAWRLTANAGMSTEVPSPADTSDAVLKAARQAYAALKNFWTTPTTGVAIPTFWFVSQPTNIGGNPLSTGLYISDSIPGSAPFGADPERYPVIIPVDANAPTTGYEDPALAPTWSFSGGTPPSTGTLAGSSPLGSALSRYVPGYPFQQFVCLGDAPVQSLYVTYKVNFVMSGSTGSGTIDYLFRDVKPSCNQPNELKSQWHLVVPFTAVRVK